MKTRSTPLFLLALAPVAVALDGAAATGGTSELAYKGYRNWKLVLPAEQLVPISGGIPVAHAGGDSFAAKLVGGSLAVDTDGDGKTDVEIEGKEDDFGVRHGFVTLRGKTPAGGELKYMARLVDEGKGWHFAASGAMVGEIDGTKVQVIDQNNNGRYDDVGEDALIVGRGNYAGFLSETATIDGKLYSITVSADGSRIDRAPYEGETGTLDLATGLETQGKLQSILVQSVDGKHCFDLARLEGVQVPVGEYKLHSGLFGLKSAVAHVTPGRMKTIEVTAGETTAPAWGGPLKGEFLFHRNGGEVVISPTEVSYYGRGGEEYRIWDPVGKSPEFTIKEVKAGTEIAKAMFPGSC